MTISCDFGDVVVLEFRYTNQTGSGLRPAVVVSVAAYHESHDDVILMPITGQLHQQENRYAVAIEDWQAAGLLKPSVIKPVVGTYEKSELHKKLGRLSAPTRLAIKRSLAGMLGFRQAPAIVAPATHPDHSSGPI
jgi:mRNA interferase MazF